MNPFRLPLVLLLVPAALLAQPSARPLPLRQSGLGPGTPTVPLSLDDVSQLDRWIGTGVRDVRWAPDGSVAYFRWAERPGANDDPENDPWWQADRRGASPVPDSAVGRIPGAAVQWSQDRRFAAWESRGRVVVWDGTGTRIAVAGPVPARHLRVAPGGRAADFLLGDDLFRWEAATGELRRLTRLVRRPRDTRTDAQKWLAGQQRELFGLIRDRDAQAREAAAREARRDPRPPQAVPIEDGQIEDLQLSPDGRYLTVRTVTVARNRPPTLYLDYVTASGYAEAKESRGKVGEPQDVVKLGVIRVDPTVPDDSVTVRWVTVAEAGGRAAVPSGPYWSLEGDRAVIAVVSQDHHDYWIARLDPERATATVVDHHRDEAWLGGPPIQPQYTLPGLIEWLPGGRLVFASERGGFSHLWLAEPGGAVRALTSGPWEVRAAALSPDRSTWLLGTSQDHPSDDRLFTMPAAGGPLTRLTPAEGRSEGVWSPDGRTIAVVASRTDRLPDLWLRSPLPADTGVRITVSGSDEYWRHRWLRPEIVTIPHPDGKPVWAGLYRPAKPDPRKPAVIYVHGGGYRQFAHRGWSVYGYSHASHYGMLNWLVQQGYTVLDFDYRGSAGYGRDYRTDIYRSMGQKDVDGAVAAARWLTATQGVDPKRIGMYGVSYGGFMTLMSLFRYPGVFGAGIAAAGVTDWAHYSDEWTSRILGLPAEQPDVYRKTSPITYADRLADPLLIEHGILDDNVEFQDAARLIQRLVEAGRPSFETVIYPTEPHVIEQHASLVDFHRRLAGFFAAHLLGAKPGR